MAKNKNMLPPASEIGVMPQQINVEAELIKMLYQQGYTAILTIIVTAIGIAVIYYGEFPDLIVFTWFSVVIALSFIRYLSIKKYRARDSQAGDDIRWG